MLRLGRGGKQANGSVKRTPNADISQREVLTNNMEGLVQWAISFSPVGRSVEGAGEWLGEKGFGSR